MKTKDTKNLARIMCVRCSSFFYIELRRGDSVDVRCPSCDMELAIKKYSNGRLSTRDANAVRLPTSLASSKISNQLSHIKEELRYTNARIDNMCAKVDSLTEFSRELFDLIKGRRIVRNSKI